MLNMTTNKYHAFESGSGVERGASISSGESGGESLQDGHLLRNVANLITLAFHATSEDISS